MNRRGSGFSLVELMIVVLILLILAALTVPSIQKVVGNYQLDSSGRVLASKLQDARMEATKSNEPYYASFDPAKAPGTFTAAPANRSYDPTIDPTAIVAASVAYQTPSGLNTSQLNTALGGTPQINGTIGFNARGAPCVASATSNLVCNPAGPGGFAWFIQSTTTQNWAAITVSPTGRIRSWRQTSPGNWQ